MAITGAQLQTAFGVTSMQVIRVLRELPPYGGTLQYWYVIGNQAYHGRCRKVETTASDNAVTQANAIAAALAAGVAP